MRIVLMFFPHLQTTQLNNGILFTLWRNYGSNITLKYIHGMQLVLENFIRLYGTSIHIGDCIHTLPDNVHRVLDKTLMSKLTNENDIHMLLDTTRDIFGDHI